MDWNLQIPGNPYCQISPIVVHLPSLHPHASITLFQVNSALVDKCIRLRSLESGSRVDKGFPIHESSPGYYRSWASLKFHLFKIAGTNPFLQRNSKNLQISVWKGYWWDIWVVRHRANRLRLCKSGLQGPLPRPQGCSQGPSPWCRHLHLARRLAPLPNQQDRLNLLQTPENPNRPVIHEENSHRPDWFQHLEG